MKRKNPLIILMLALLAFVNQASGQTADPLKTLVSKIGAVHDQFPQEKVHLHFDKPFYTIGDTIWFKAYVVNADKNELSALSNVLYVDLINSNNTIERSLKLSMALGSARGDFVLGDSTLSEGSYRVRAYTNWMRNFGEDYFFDKMIDIGNSLSNNVITKSAFTFSETSGKELITADITYSLLDGSFLASKEVSYSIALNGRNIDKGKGTTNERGVLKVQFVNEKPGFATSGRITTTIKLDERKSIQKIIPIKSVSDSISIQFFPEGGQLVEGITSKVALKVLRPDGLSAEVSGYIADQNNNKITEFKTEHAGMGTFSLMPLAGTSYKAVIKSAEGLEKSFLLPKAETKGYVLSIDNSSKDAVKVKVMVSPQALSESPEIMLIAQSNNNIHYTAKTKLQLPVLSTSIPKERFLEGIVQFTLFTGDNIPVAERLVFIDHPDDQLTLNLQTDKPSYLTREKVKMNLDAGNTNGGNFSVAVTDMTKVPADEDAETTIFSSLLLNSDLKGYIEKPNYYFTGKKENPRLAEQKAKQLDNLMLTQGWRKFEWKQLLGDTIAKPVFEAEKGISFIGKIVGAGSKKPIPNGKLLLFSPNGGGLIADTVADVQGKFRFDYLGFPDSIRFVLQARNAKDRGNVLIQLDNVPNQILSKNKNAPDVMLNVPNSMIAYLKSSRDRFDEMRKYGMMNGTGIMLREVSVNAKRTNTGGRETLEGSTNRNLSGHYDYVIKAEQLKGFVFLSDALRSKVPGLTMAAGDPYLSGSGNMRITGGQPRPMIIVIDGVILTPSGSAQGDLPPPVRGSVMANDTINDISKYVPETSSPLNNLTLAEVETIEVLRPGPNSVIYGSDVGSGVLVITTKKGPDRPVSTDPAPGILSFRPKGYKFSRQFSSPVYGSSEIRSSMADLRTTIYWNPDLITGTDGKSSFEFYTADTPGTYRAVVEGLDLSGQLGRKVFTYTVK